ncbi:MAG: glycosyl transferase, WecB/TagA/CpsF family [Fibrobacteres bacterium]|nr:glycosyl transferase, WecB/TagA/CpsF family [Fibrobacterota bacterium]
MINLGKFPILGVNVHAVDYGYAVSAIVEAASQGRPCSVSALAVHGVMTGFQDPIHSRRLNGLDLVVPDGQPVRWALKWLHGKSLPDRVYGPNLTLYTAKAMAEKGLGIYLYGSTAKVLAKFSENLKVKFPGLIISGSEPSKFRRLIEKERAEVIERVKASGAKAVFVGLGCPRQEVWAFEYREALGMPILAVGAAFDFHAGTLPQAPRFMQDRGLEWLFRLVQEPKRLWRRYVILNPLYLLNVALQKLSIRVPVTAYPEGSEPNQSFG